MYYNCNEVFSKFQSSSEYIWLLKYIIICAHVCLRVNVVFSQLYFINLFIHIAYIQYIYFCMVWETQLLKYQMEKSHYD